MDVLISLFYVLFALCIVFPPTEFVSAGFTIPQLFGSYLGSEENNFVKYHMRRIPITLLIHSFLPLGYVVTLWCCGEQGEWMPCLFIASCMIPLIALYKITCWWEHNQINHPVVKALLPYAEVEGDWRTFASTFNMEFRGSNNIFIPLNNVSTVKITTRWIIKVSQYSVNLVQQGDCTLVATATDTHDLAPTGEGEMQYLNIEAIPERENVKPFSFRISSITLRELQPRLERPVRVPEHISLIPPLIERFISVFKDHVRQNPVYYVDQELEQCIGCMHNQADIKINKRCVSDSLNGTRAPCQQCNCRVLWCAPCMARWWAARAGSLSPNAWLAARGSCPVCRAVFCMVDVSPAEKRRVSH
ncbi:E3 ubiquitin-protein ligase TM129 [Pieris rapae]|uniref:E3 ubiquitin-protein ligase TM129 n=1 Tax=Pieris rapae TaxID=64459 RepID=UPI000B92DE3B|nr:E3 ubiquitin-protein ligase TM129 [Pieris rapae]